MTFAQSSTIRTATAADAATVANLMAEAFLHGDLAPWLIPHLDTRARVYRPYFALLLEQAFDYGHVEVVDQPKTGLTAVAVWYSITGGPPLAPDKYPTRLAQITGQHLQRFTALDNAMHDHHPYEAWHHYLAFLAVHPDCQRQRLGSTLLEHHHTALDVSDTPAYLEATGSLNARLYARHGYRPRPNYRIGSKGPALYPMWRPPVRLEPTDTNAGDHALRLRPGHPAAAPRQQV